MPETQKTTQSSQWQWVYWVFAAVGAYYLVTRHSAHLLDYLPYVLLMACPLMHLFHRHGGHGSQHDHQRDNRKEGK
jgi:hypothetical protein